MSQLCDVRETTPDWDKEIGEDVKEECGKFGAVNHIYVDRNSKVSSQSQACRYQTWVLLLQLLCMTLLATCFEGMSLCFFYNG